MPENQEERKVVREVKVEDVTLIVSVPKGEASNLKKEVRHRLDNSSHNLEEGKLSFVKADWDKNVVPHGPILEVIVTGLDCTIHMDKDVEHRDVAPTCHRVLKCSPSVIAVGHMKIAEHYTREL